VRNIFRRLARRADPWSGIWSDGQAIEPAAARLRDA
jgi:hypothetical protein